MSRAVRTHPATAAKLAASQAFQAPPDQDTDTTRRSAETNPPYPTKPTTAPKLAVTRILSTNPRILTKSFSLKENEIVKTSIAQMTRGAAELCEVVGLSGLRDLLEGLPRNAALVYGVAADHPRAQIVSEKDLPQHPDAISRTRRFFGFRRAPGVLMLDHDPDDGTPFAPADLIATLRSLAPCLAAVPILWRASASTGIARTGEQGPLKGQRLYLAVDDAARIPEAGKALTALLWAAGHGKITIGKAGQALERTLFDTAVWQPERLDFAAAPAVGEGLARMVPPPFIDGDPDGPCLALRDLIAAADGTIHQQAGAARKAARAAAKPQLDEAREAWIEETAAGLVPEDDEEKRKKARETLRRAVFKHELTGDFLLLAANGATPTVGDLLDNPAKWHGQRFADPLEPDYGHDRRIAWANLRSGGRPYLHSHAHGGRRFALIRPSARIQLKKGDRARVVDQILDAMRERGELYDMGEGATLSRVTTDARALPVARDWLTDHLDRVFTFYTLVPAKPDKPPEEEITDAPAWAAMRIAAKDGERRFHRLDAVVTAPTLRADGSILSEPGYDAVARLLLVTDAPAMPHIPTAPTQAQAAEALRVLWRPFELFPLVDAIDRGVVLAALLTACLRASLPTAPGFGFDAPTAGTGKTLLGQAIGALSLGTTPAALPPAGNVDEEARKRLFAALRDGHRVILWDNVREPMGNAALDAFLTAPTFQDRILGVSQTATLPNRALFLTTGNNLRLVGDTCRRILTARLDAQIERPYAREFDFCPLALVLAHRLDLVAAALTLIRAWTAQGRPRMGAGRTASFETWDDLIRQPICWVSSWDSRYTDPLDATARAFELDPETAKLAALLTAWSARFGNHPTTTAELVAATEEPASTFQERSGATPDPDEHRAALADAVEEIAGDRGKINRRILGRWIERHAERRHNGQRLIRGKLRRGAPTWILVQDRARVSE